MWRNAGPRRTAAGLERLLDDPYPLARLIAASAPRASGITRRAPTIGPPDPRREPRRRPPHRRSRRRAPAGALALSDPESDLIRSDEHVVTDRVTYRELGPRVIEDEYDSTGGRNKQQVLDACEATIRRLAVDGRYFARPAKTLFNDVRTHFAMATSFSLAVIERNIALAKEFLAGCPRAPRSPACHASADPTPARERRASVSRFRAGTTARRTSTSRSPSRRRSCRSRRSRPSLTAS